MSTPYSNTGEGLQRSVDPVDNEVYLYSQGETAFIRKMYPCFDQPDLKATFTLDVTAPAHWQVISNNPVREKIDLAEKKSKCFLYAAAFLKRSCNWMTPSNS